MTVESGRLPAPMDRLAVGDILTLLKMVSGVVTEDSEWQVVERFPARGTLTLRKVGETSPFHDRHISPTDVWAFDGANAPAGMPTLSAPLSEPMLYTYKSDVRAAGYWLMEHYSATLSDIKECMTAVLDTVHLRHSRTIARLLNKPKV